MQNSEGGSDSPASVTLCPSAAAQAPAAPPVPASPQRVLVQAAGSAPKGAQMQPISLPRVQQVPQQTDCLCLQPRASDVRPQQRSFLLRGPGRRPGDRGRLLPANGPLAQHGGHHHGCRGEPYCLQRGSLSHPRGDGQHQTLPGPHLPLIASHGMYEALGGSRVDPE
ncbi:DNA-binding protein RFX2-like isoform X2 [Leptonychotes weddellii]|uniref:DNA-binding protein RFX2-like isoform X2 n=1 Tax=Leptonychotes weddellii TaxID=9713 RepID=A0A7F8Q5J2_LEPWE|nr:DNA-binding protein RFX2-like isoform X2 [Leptonychotes weddellii]